MPYSRSRYQRPKVSNRRRGRTPCSCSFTARPWCAAVSKPPRRTTSGSAAICAQLDGLPLALELAAARLKMLTPAALYKRLDRALDLKTADGRRTGRQQTLGKAIEWSYDLLDLDPQRLLRLLSVFPGGVTFETLDDVIDRLGGPSTRTRSANAWWMPRWWSRERQLTANRASACSTRFEAFAAEMLRRHVDHGPAHRAALAWAEEVINHPDHAGDGPAYARYQSSLEREFENLSHHVEVALDPDGGADSEQGLRLVPWLVQHFASIRHSSLSLRWLRQALAGSEDAAVAERARALVNLAYELNAAGDYDDAFATIEKGLALGGAAESASSADAELSEVEVDALHVRAILRTVSGDVEGAIHDYEHVIRKDRHNAPVYRVHARLNLGSELSKAGRHDEALHLLAEAEALSRDLGFHGSHQAPCTGRPAPSWRWVAWPTRRTRCGRTCPPCWQRVIPWTC